MAVDANLVVASAQALSGAGTQTFPVSGLNIGEAPEDGLDLVVRCSKKAGTSPTLDINLKASATSGGTYTTFASTDQVTGTTTSGWYTKKRFINPPGKPWLKVDFVLGGTAPDYGTMDAFISNDSTPDINKNQ